MSLIPDGFRIGESSMSTFNVFKPAPHFNHGIESRYGIGGSVIVSKAFFDFGVSRGPSDPQAASDGRVKIAAIEVVRIFLTTGRPRAFCFSARAETMD